MTDPSQNDEYRGSHSYIPPIPPPRRVDHPRPRGVLTAVNLPFPVVGAVLVGLLPG